MPLGNPGQFFKGSIQKSLLKEGSWVFFGQILSALGTLVGVRLLTEKVVPEIYGGVSLLIGVVTFGRSIFCLPFCQAALRFYPDQSVPAHRSALKRVVSRLLLHSSALLILAMLVAGFAYGIYRGQSSLPIMLLSLLLGIDAWRSLDSTFLTAGRNQKAYSIWGALDSWGRPLCALLAVLLIGVSTHSVMLGYALASGTLLLVFNLLPGVVTKLGSIHDEPVQKTARLRKEIIAYALPLMPIAAVAWITQLGDRYLIGGLLGTEKVGIYAAAYGLASFPFLFVQSGIESTLRPLYFDAVVNRDKDRERKFFKAMLLSTSALCTLGVLFLWLLRYPIVHLALAVKYADAVILLPWIALGYAFLAVSYVFQKACYAYKKTHLILGIESLGALATVAFDVPLIYYRGIQGAAMAVPLYFGVYLGISYYMYLRVGTRQ